MFHINLFGTLRSSECFKCFLPSFFFFFLSGELETTFKGTINTQDYCYKIFTCYKTGYMPIWI